MAISGEAREWWSEALLHETTSAHPEFGRDIHLKVEGDVLILNGTVQDAEKIDEIENEARHIGKFDSIVNHLTVAPGGEIPHHMQTVIAVFDDGSQAELACRSVTDARIHESSKPRLIRRAADGERFLLERAEAAQSGPESIKKYVEALDHDKVLLVDRVPEDDALRVISTLEGSTALVIETLPPEPEAVEESPS